MQLLRARLFDMEQQKQNEEVYKQRKSQVGTGSRSEKIRTYNYKDSRCTDHRLSQNFPLQGVLTGALEPIHNMCAAGTQEELLQEFLSGNK
jgi:peptide chain release factor 1